MGERFAATVEALESAVDRRASLCAPFVSLLPVTGASISTIGGWLEQRTVCFSDQRAARLDELQFDLGEGPSWDAVRLRAPVFEPDVAGSTSVAWPEFRVAIARDGVGSIFAFPLTIGPISIGALDLYSLESSMISDSEAREVSALAEVAARQVLRKVLLEAAGPVADLPTDGMSRTIVHQATGMVIAQLDISARDAALVLRGRAYSSGRTVREVAQDVVDRVLDFSDDIPTGRES